MVNQPWLTSNTCTRHFTYHHIKHITTLLNSFRGCRKATQGALRNRICHPWLCCLDIHFRLFTAVFTLQAPHNCVYIKAQYRKKTYSHIISRERRVVKNRYSWLLFTNYDRFCDNLRVQEQSANVMPQCLYPTFAWGHRSNVVTSQC